MDTSRTHVSLHCIIQKCTNLYTPNPQIQSQPQSGEHIYIQHMVAPMCPALIHSTYHRSFAIIFINRYTHLHARLMGLCGILGRTTDFLGGPYVRRRCLTLRALIEHMHMHIGFGNHSCVWLVVDSLREKNTNTLVV